MELPGGSPDKATTVAHFRHDGPNRTNVTAAFRLAVRRNGSDTADFVDIGLGGAAPECPRRLLLFHRRLVINGIAVRRRALRAGPTGDVLDALAKTVAGHLTKRRRVAVTPPHRN